MKMIRTAIASYGMSGQVFHGPLLEIHEGFSVVAVLERHANNSEGKHPDAMLVRDYRKIIDNEDVELVIVNTPDHLHFEMCMQALEAGKHVVVEKPFTIHYKDALRLIDFAKEMGLMLSVYQNRRWDGDFLTVQKVIQDGQLGRLVSFESHFDRFRNYIQDSWKEDDTLGAGTLYNLGSHMIDQALVLFGMPEYVFADVRGLRTGSKVDDSFDLHFHFKDLKCLVRGSYLVKETGPRYILHGTEGSFLKYGLDPQETALKEGRIPRGSDWGKDISENYGLINTQISGLDERISIETIPGDYMAFYDNIHDHLRKGKPLAVPAVDGANVIKVIEASYKSAESGQTVALD